MRGWRCTGERMWSWASGWVMMTLKGHFHLGCVWKISCNNGCSEQGHRVSHFQIFIQKCLLAMSNTVCAEIKRIPPPFFHENEVICRIILSEGIPVECTFSFLWRHVLLNFYIFVCTEIVCRLSPEGSWSRLQPPEKNPKRGQKMDGWIDESFHFLIFGGKSN